MTFYEQVLRELVVALGAALFLANGLALLRRRRDADEAVERTVARIRPGSPVRGNRTTDRERPADLPQAPVVRSVLYLLIGFVVMVWGIASLTA